MLKSATLPLAPEKICVYFFFLCFRQGRERCKSSHGSVSAGR